MPDHPWFVLRGQLNGGTSSGASPDIIIGGPTPDPQYAQDYGKAFPQTANFSGSNFVYVRAKNSGTALAIGNVSVFATHLRDLPHQGLWTQLQTTDGRQSTNIAADAGVVATSGAALIWEPGGVPAPGAPWCLIAEISGDDHPRIQVPATVTDRASFDTWIATHPRLAYLVVHTPDVVPVAAPSFTWAREVSLANAAATTLAASLTGTSGTAGGFLAYAFDKNDSSGQPIGVGKTLYQLNTAYSQSRTVPAGFTSKVTVTYTPAADQDANAEFVLQIATETSDGDGGDLGTSDSTVVAQYTLSFGQTRSGGVGG